jgi:hypothetical protein
MRDYNWIDVLTAFSTLAAVLVALLIALYGSWLSSIVPGMRPRLNIELVSPKEPIPIKVKLDPKDGNPPRFEKSWWYYARVSNPRRRWTKATQVQVFLIKVEEEQAKGETDITWSQEIPVQWHLQEVKPLQATVGPSDTFPVCSLVKDKWVELYPLAHLFSLEHKKRKPFKLIITFQARSVEIDSRDLRVEIVWKDGWSDDRKELLQYMTVRELPNEKKNS